MTVAKMIMEVWQLKFDVPDLIEATMLDLRPDIANSNVKQMLAGTTSKGEPIKPNYAPSTQKRKGFVTPNLYDKGPFQAGVFADVQYPNYSTYSTDEKAAALTVKYKNIWGLDEQSKMEVRRKGSILLIDKVQEKLDL